MTEGRKSPVLPARYQRMLYTGIVCFIVCMMTVAVVYFLTNAKDAKVEEAVSGQVAEVSPTYQSMETNPLEINRNTKIQEAVEQYYQDLAEQEDYAEAYDKLTIYYKQGEAAGSRILYTEYAMKIQGIYTEVPGLGTMYARLDESGEVQLDPVVEDEEVKAVIEEVSGQEDVQELFAKVEAAYEEAVQSDVMLAQALEDLKNAVNP